MGKKMKSRDAALKAKIAGVSISKMIDILREYGIEANLEYEDYLKSLKTVRKMWYKETIQARNFFYPASPPSA